MIALLLAAQLSAAPVAAEVARGLPAAPLLGGPGQSFVTRIYPPTRRCRGAAHFQTALPAEAETEPALLLRPQDRIGPRKLKDLPPATPCLTANPQEAAR